MWTDFIGFAILKLQAHLILEQTVSNVGISVSIFKLHDIFLMHCNAISLKAFNSVAEQNFVIWWKAGTIPSRQEPPKSVQKDAPNQMFF